MRLFTFVITLLLAVLFAGDVAHAATAAPHLQTALADFITIDPLWLLGAGALGMSISTQDPVLAWRRIENYIHGLKPASQFMLRALKSYLSQQGGNPDLQVVPFDELSDTDVVVADAACKLYALVLQKDSATASFTKLTDHATTGSDTAPDIGIKSPGLGKEHLLIYPDGLALASGATMQGTTTADGGTGSASNGCKGFAIIGAP